jgi:phosphoglycolate phosphatase
VIRNLIFDWSGTLVDDLPAVLAATNHVFDKCGAPPLTLDRFRAEFCLPFERFYARFLPGVPVAELERTFHACFTQAQKAVEELPHAREFLLFCRKHGLRSFVLSTIHPDYYAAQTALNGFDKFMERAYLAVWDKRTKIAEVLADNRLAAAETLFVGDMQHDIETARHGGVFSCAVLTGYNRLEQLRASEPDLIVEHLGELREILARRKFDLRHAGHEAELPIADIQLVLAQDCIRSREFYREAHFVLLNYTCRVEGPAGVRLNEEAEEFCWVPPEVALKMELNQPTRILLNKVKAS